LKRQVENENNRPLSNHFCFCLVTAGALITRWR